MSIQVGKSSKLINLRLSTGSAVQAGNSTVSGNTIKLQLNSSIKFTQGSYVSLSSLSIPYSWQNITQALNNTQFQYIFNGLTRNVNIPEGSYNYSDFTLFLQSVMQQNGDYLVDANGNNVYFLDLTINPIYYAITLTATIIPTSLQTGWTNPNLITLSGTTPQLQVLANNFQSYIGFPQGIYPATPQTQTYYQNSPNPPQVSAISSVLVRCNLVNNFGYSNPADVLYEFTPTSGSFGTQLEIKPTNLLYNTANQTDVSYIEVGFYTQSNQILVLRDTSNISVNLTAVIM